MKYTFVKFIDLLEDNPTPRYGCLISYAGEDIEIIDFSNGQTVSSDFDIIKELDWSELAKLIKENF